MTGHTAPHHPLTGAPIVPLGYRKNGRAIWPILGASEDQPAPAAPAAGDPTPTPTPAPPATPPGDPDDGKGGKEAILADLAKERDKRQALEQRFTEAETERQKQLEAFAVALGIKPEDAPDDPAKLLEQVTAEQSKTAEAEARATKAERSLAVFLAAPELGANAVALLDSASFLQKLDAVDATDAAALSGLIKESVEANPAYRATTTPPTFGGGPRPGTDKADVAPGVDRIRQAYANAPTP